MILSTYETQNKKFAVKENDDLIEVVLLNDDGSLTVFNKLGIPNRNREKQIERMAKGCLASFNRA